MIGSFTARRLALVCIAVMLILVFGWIGGFVFFVNTDTWSEAKALIAVNKSYPVAAGDHVDPKLRGFSYRFSGAYEAFEIGVSIGGIGIERHFRASFERSNGKLRMLRMRPDD